MQENSPITQLLVYELTRQNQGILTDLKEAGKTYRPVNIRTACDEG